MFSFLNSVHGYLTILGTVLISFCACTSTEEQDLGFTHRPVTQIAFGSCNHQDKPQPLWTSIMADQPDLWIWLGDAIYANTKDPELMLARYNQQHLNRQYRSLSTRIPVIGTWDDHDYGQNNAGKRFEIKEESQRLFQDFMGLSADHPARHREGVYSSYTLGPKGRRVKIILLDTRYFRDDPTIVGGEYLPNEEGDILGEEQWQWLKGELNTPAALYIVGSGIQVLPYQQRYEKWANFSTAKDRLLRLLKGKHVLLLSGDRHLGELSQWPTKEGAAPLVEVTSSGLTHSWENFKGESNSLRMGEPVPALNYGLLSLAWTDSLLHVNAAIKGEGDTTYVSERLTYPLY